MARTRTPTAETPAGEIARAVRAEMARAGVTGEQLADHLGLSQRAMSRRLTGDTPFRADELAATATVLGVSVTVLMPEPAPGGVR